MQTNRNQSVAPANRSSGSRGFTLVEVLTVLLIIGILVALLSASLNKTQSRALRVSCVDNLKQLQLAWQLYADDNEDLIALNKTAAGGGNYLVYGRRASTNSWVAGNPKEDINTAKIERGTLYPFSKSPRIYRCPMDNSRVIGHHDILRTRSYSMDTFLGGDDEGKDPRVKTRLADVERQGADKIFVFIEEHESSSWADGFQVLPREGTTLSGGTWSSTPSDRHEQGCNLTFADGHVDYWKWYAPKKGNLDNRLTASTREIYDLQRLQRAVPKP
jgi:prepilin-type N-terminal cleavage/methylation domain-containing protein/prepilin-type processing-associated H-X9-DG protein